MATRPLLELTIATPRCWTMPPSPTSRASSVES